MIPKTYLEWRRCIEVDCGLALTPDFVAGRLAELRDGQNERTAQFARRYGREHLQRVIAWFEQAASDG